MLFYVTEYRFDPVMNAFPRTMHANLECRAGIPVFLFYFLLIYAYLVTNLSQACRCGVTILFLSPAIGILFMCVDRCYRRISILKRELINWGKAPNFSVMFSVCNTSPVHEEAI